MIQGLAPDGNSPFVERRRRGKRALPAPGSISCHPSRRVESGFFLVSSRKIRRTAVISGKFRKLGGEVRLFDAGIREYPVLGGRNSVVRRRVQDPDEKAAVPDSMPGFYGGCYFPIAELRAPELRRDLRGERSILERTKKQQCLLQQIIRCARSAFRLISRQRNLAGRILNGALRKPLIGSIPGIRGGAGFNPDGRRRRRLNESRGQLVKNTGIEAKRRKNALGGVRGGNVAGLKKRFPARFFPYWQRRLPFPRRLPSDPHRSRCVQAATPPHPLRSALPFSRRLWAGLRRSFPPSSSLPIRVRSAPRVRDPRRQRRRIPAGASPTPATFSAGRRLWGKRLAAAYHAGLRP